jgi:hypothetical protein
VAALREGTHPLVSRHCRPSASLRYNDDRGDGPPPWPPRRILRAGFTWWRGGGRFAVDAHVCAVVAGCVPMSLPFALWMVVAVALIVAGTFVVYLLRRGSPWAW